MLLVAALLAWFHAPLLRALAGPLVVDQTGDEARYVLVLEGMAGGDGRYAAAAELHRQVSTRRIVVVPQVRQRVVRLGILPPLEAIAQRELTRQGVPPQSVELLPGKAIDEWSTVRLLDSWLKQHPDSKLVVLADRFQSRYVRHVLDTLLDAQDAARVSIVTLRDRRFDESDWWRSRCGMRGLVFGYLQLAYAHVVGEPQAAGAEWDPDQYEQELRGGREATPTVPQAEAQP